MKIYYPDYQNCNAGVSSSVFAYYGVETRINKIPFVSSLLESKPRNVLLMLFDGMGIDAVERHLPEDSFLRRHFVQPLSSVFPPTTTAATTAIQFGLLPAAHGWLSWALYFPELDCNVELFRNTVYLSDGKPAADYPIANTYMPLPDVYKLLSGMGGLTEAGSISPFGTIPADSMDALFGQAEARCKMPGRHYYYCYWNDPDDKMHKTGVGSSETKAVITEIDQRVEKLCQDLAGTDTLLLATADHGLIDVRFRFLRDTPEVAAHLLRPMAMETRHITFFIKPGHQEAFARDFNAAYGEDFMLLTREEVFAQKLFGDGPEHPRFRQSIGDFLAIAKREACLVEGPCKYSEKFLADHAGLTEQEMLVPLFAVRC